MDKLHSSPSPWLAEGGTKKASWGAKPRIEASRRGEKRDSRHLKKFHMRCDALAVPSRPWLGNANGKGSGQAAQTMDKSCKSVKPCCGSLQLLAFREPNSFCFWLSFGRDVAWGAHGEAEILATDRPVLCLHCT
ncbi:unnamed protein product [Effrenium voratum]|nr:unnamed protein product [Effrenium voratum]